MVKQTIFEPDYVVDLRVQLGKVIKLNEQLTAENARIWENLDVSNGLVDDLRLEITSIKSKWWYKLMTWGW